MSTIGSITPKQLKDRLQRGEKPAMIDVREHDEVAHGMVPGAVHIPLGELPERLRDIPQDGEVIFICRSGNRSGRACEYLQSQGLNGLVNMAGGMLEWEKLR